MAKKTDTFFGGMLGRAEGSMKTRTSRVDAAVDAATGTPKPKTKSPPRGGAPKHRTLSKK